MKTAARPPLKSRPQTDESLLITIDYPERKDTIVSRQYTIRVGAPELSQVEVSIDDGDWRPCRHSVGYWWYDWSGYAAGPHRLAARGRRGDGRIAATAPRQFDVAFDARELAGA